MSMTERPDPWRVPVAVAQIPDTGLHRDLDADQATRNAMADLGGLREVLSVHASFDVTPKSGGRFHVAGHVRARVGQTCVVTLEEIESDIDEPIDLIFAPPEQIPQMAALVDEADRATRTRPIRRSRSRTASSISAGLPPTRCISASILIRASRMRFSNRGRSRPIRKIIPLRRSRR